MKLKCVKCGQIVEASLKSNEELRCECGGVYGELSEEKFQEEMWGK